MKILLWNGMLVHYEMFGYIIEYCKKYNHTLDIKTRIVNVDNGTSDLGMLYWYSVKFENSFKIVEKINLYDYDYIFLPTDDDLTIISELLELKDDTIFDRLIVIDNDFDFRNLWTKHHISTRYHPKRPLVPYALPCYRVIKKKEKKEIISKVANINIALIAPEIFDRDLEHILNKYKSQVKIYQINYKIKSISDKYKDIVRPYEKLEQGYLEYILNSCQYILIPSNINIRKFFMSGAMALAYNYGCRLILPDGWKDDFKMDMAISNNENIELFRVNMLDDIFEERERIILKRDKLFNRILAGENIYIDPDINFIPSKRHNLIPKKLYQIWICDNSNDSLILPMKNLVNLWKQYNPNYEYTLIGNSDAKQLLTENFNVDVYTAYTKLRSGGFKADLLRYCVLYVNGGVYVDVDTVCLNSIDRIVDRKDELVTVIDFNEDPDEGEHNLANGFIAVKKEHPVLKMCIDKIVDNVMNDKKVDSMLDYTGPGLLGRCVNLYLNRQETDSFIGMEGRDDIHNIKFLKFEREREIMKYNDNILLQNKGGNKFIERFYGMQCSFSNTKQWIMDRDILSGQ